MTDPYFALWTVAMIVFIAVEAVTLNLVTTWFALGALAALIAELSGALFGVQVLIFFVVSAISLALLFPLAKKYFTGKKVATNADRVVGKKGIVLSKIDNTLGTGQVKVSGVIWSARSSDGTVIEEKSDVLVLSIEGVKLIVEKTNL